MRANEFITPIKKEFQDPADDPNAGFDKEFKQDSIFNQMGKILDSRGNPNPIKKVVSDSGKKYDITPEKAQTLKMMLTTDAVKPDVKRKFTTDIQNDDVLGMMLDAKDQKEMIGMFKAAYMSDGGNKERSAYTS